MGIINKGMPIKDGKHSKIVFHHFLFSMYIFGFTSFLPVKWTTIVHFQNDTKLMRVNQIDDTNTGTNQ